MKPHFFSKIMALFSIIACLAPVTLFADVFYENISYNQITVGSSPSNGTLNSAVVLYWNYDYYEIFNATGYSFNATANQAYKVTVKYTQNPASDFGACFYLLKDNLEGYLDDDIISESCDSKDNATEITLTNFYKSLTEGNVNILLRDGEHSNYLDYTITVEQVNIPLYTELSYTTPIANGSVTVNDNYLIENYHVTGKGHYYDVQENSVYKITSTFNSTTGAFDGAFGILFLKSGTLQGTDDIIKGFGGDYDTQVPTQGTLTGYFKATATEQLKVLLYDFNLNNYNYTISIEKVPAPMALTQLLNNTTKIIAYSNNLEFADRGTTVNLVNGIRDNAEDYYAVAYKITLQENDYIKIHSSKEKDSYLYLYKADGMGGYEVIADNDDGGYGNTSYLEFTAYTAGDYYIVVTDFDAYVAGRYYLTVWNTNDEPANDYMAPIITTTTLPQGEIKTAYSATLEASGTQPITWEKVSGNLPDGLTLNTTTGTITGTPTTAGTFNFTVKASNSLGFDEEEFSITIVPEATPIIAGIPKVNTLKALAQNGTLRLNGLTAGKTWSVYTVSGTLVNTGVASGTEANLNLNAGGVYLVKSNGQTIKVVNR